VGVVVDSLCIFVFLLVKVSVNAEVLAHLMQSIMGSPFSEL
jgi:hypothetical protein